MAVEPLLATRAQRFFMITIAIQAIVVLAMVGITFRMVSDHVDFGKSQWKTLPCYLALFALAEIFELLMALDALRLRNVIQLLGILTFHVALVVFAALQVHQTRSAMVTLHNCDASVSFINCDGRGTLWRRIEPYLIVAPCIIAASWFIMMFWIKQLYEEFGWAIFHVVGANPKMKNMFQWYQIIICLLKFDFFCFTGVTMQLLIIVLAANSAEFGVTIAAIPVVLVLLAACGWALQREIKWLMTVSLVLMLAAMGYFYKLVRIWEPVSREQYATTRATLTIFTIVSFLLLFGTFLVGIKCFTDFDKGLQASKLHGVQRRPKFLSNGNSTGNMSERQTSYTGGAGITQRISIE